MSVKRPLHLCLLVTVLGGAVAGASASAQTAAAPPVRAPAREAIAVAPGTPPVIDPANLYSEAASGHMSAAVAGAL
jgi:hypothetical protein